MGEVARPDDPNAASALGENACGGSGAYAEPLVVDWSSSARLDLEVAMKEGVAVVSYDCDAMRLLKGCSLPGDYRFAGVSRKEEVIQLASEDELQANFKAGGFAVGAGLSRGSSLDIAMVLVGKRSSGAASPTRDELAGRCDGATHFVDAATVGAFAVGKGTAGSAMALVDVFGAGGVSGSSASTKQTLTKDGDLGSCRSAAPDASDPPKQCGSAIRLELIRISSTPATAATSEGAAPRHARCDEGLVFANGKCTVAVGPHECLPEDLADCETQCEAGNAASCHNLALAYDGGNGVERDGDRADRLFRRACAADWFDACGYAGFSHAVEEPPDMKTAVALVRKGCNGGSGHSCSEFGDFYNSGSGVPKNLERARKLYERGCALGFAVACSQVGYLYDNGDGVPKDTKTAASWYFRGCNGGDAAICIFLGEQLRFGKNGYAKDPEHASTLLKMACRFDPVGCNDVAEMYTKGELGEPAPGLAKKYFKYACDGGKREACGK